MNKCFCSITAVEHLFLTNTAQSSSAAEQTLAQSQSEKQRWYCIELSAHPTMIKLKYHKRISPHCSSHALHGLSRDSCWSRHLEILPWMLVHCPRTWTWIMTDEHTVSFIWFNSSAVFPRIWLPISLKTCNHATPEWSFTQMLIM